MGFENFEHNQDAIVRFRTEQTSDLFISSHTFILLTQGNFLEGTDFPCLGAD